MPAVAETDDHSQQVVEDATATAAAATTTTTTTDSEAQTKDVPDSLTGIGTGLPDVETNTISDEDLLHEDDDFNATRQPEPLTT